MRDPAPIPRGPLGAITTGEGRARSPWPRARGTAAGTGARGARRGPRGGGPPELPRDEPPELDRLVRPRVLAPIDCVHVEMAVRGDDAHDLPRDFLLVAVRE